MDNSIILNLFIVMELAILEGLLSLDNAFVLAALVKKNLQSSEEQKKALFYGLVGAYTFRILAILFGVYLFRYQWVQPAVGLYLIIIAIKELFFSKPPSLQGHHKFPIKLNTQSTQRKVFWLTILNVEIMDFAFSIDSIAVALAISNKIWVLISGAAIGIILMRFAAQYFIKIMSRFPSLQKITFLFLLIIGLNVLIKYLGSMLY